MLGANGEDARLKAGRYKCRGSKLPAMVRLIGG
jgi:hypothetical protein